MTKHKTVQGTEIEIVCVREGERRREAERERQRERSGPHK